MLRALFCLILTAPVTANAYQSGQIFPFSSVKPGQFPAPVARAADLAYRIDNLGTCTGFFTSSDGYFITAMHCVSDFLLDDLEVIRDPMMISQIGRLKHPVINKPISEVDGVRRFRVNGKTPSTLVTTGSGFIWSPPDPMNAMHASGQDRERLAPFLEDFAIVKFNLDKPIPCLSIAKSEPGEKVYAFGYDSMHQDRFMVSTGNVFDRPSKLFEAGLVSYIPLMDALFDWTKLRVASSKAIGGMSGGPIVNSRGEAVGINQIMIDDLSVMPNLTWIRSKISHDLGSALSAEIFDCRSEQVQ